jgi:SAM-dependent methyltransferase
VEFSQVNYPNDLADMVAWITSLTPKGGRVLEIGCGDGTITQELAALGLEVVGVDPSAAEGPNIQSIGFEQLDAAPFDVVFASVSLHHLADLDVASQALNRLTKPGTVMAVREFDKDLVGDRATLEWCFHQRRAMAAVSSPSANRRHDQHDQQDQQDSHRGHDQQHGGQQTDQQGSDQHHADHHDHTGHAHDSGVGHRVDSQLTAAETFEDFRHRWISMMDSHVLTWPKVRHMLHKAGFATELEESTAYMFRWDLDEALRPLEEYLSSTGQIKRVGIRWLGRRPL